MLSRSARVITAAVFGLAMFVAQSARSEAATITITDVQVMFGASVYDAARVGWTFPYTLNTGEDLILAQSFNGPPNQSTSYSFDTSDEQGPGIQPVIRVTVNGVVSTFTDTNQVLNLKGVDVISLIDNEAQNFRLLSGPAGLNYRVYVAYADNVHTGACGSWASSIGLNGSTTCFPQVFNAVTYLDAAPGILPDIPVPSQGLPNHCLGGVATCYETGVIRILSVEPGQPDPRGLDPSPVPEPASLMMMMTGGGMLLARRFRRGNRTRA